MSEQIDGYGSYSDGKITLYPIPGYDEVVLKPADSVKTVAEFAEETFEEQGCAYDINYAARTGSHSIYYDHPISKHLRETLEENGYEIVECLRAADPKTHWVIRGF